MIFGSKLLSCGEFTLSYGEFVLSYGWQHGLDMWDEAPAPNVVPVYSCCLPEVAKDDAIDTSVEHIMFLFEKAL